MNSQGRVCILRFCIASTDKGKQCLALCCLLRSFVVSPSLMLQVQEVGDGNINFVYIVKGPKGALCLKQGLPFVRIAQDWPLTQVPCPSCT